MFVKSVKRIKEGVQFSDPIPIIQTNRHRQNIMHLLLEDYIEDIENQENKKLPRPSLPSVADAYRKAYYGRRKLTLKEKWVMMWRNKCYPLV